MILVVVVVVGRAGEVSHMILFVVVTAVGVSTDSCVILLIFRKCVFFLCSPLLR